MTDSNMEVKCNLLTSGISMRWSLPREKSGHYSSFHPHPASPKLWHRKPLHEGFILLSFTKQL